MRDYYVTITETLRMKLDVEAESMEEAIEKKKLCKYDYHIVLSELDDYEMHRYLDLSKKISVQSQIDKTNGNEMSDKLESLTMERARISKKCLSKWPLFFDIFTRVE